MCLNYSFCSVSGVGQHAMQRNCRVDHCVFLLLIFAAVQPATMQWPMCANKGSKAVR